LEEVSHDVVNDFWHQKRCLPREVWALGKDREESQDAFLLVDDSGQDKRYSRFIELVRAHYRGNEPRVGEGSAVVNVGHSAGQDEDFYPIDDRVYAPDVDGKTKTDPQARPRLFAGGYASAEHLQLLHRRQRLFCTTLKRNRVVRLSKEAGAWPREESEGPAARLAEGILMKLKGVPLQVRLFKLLAPDGDMDWGIPHALAETVPAQVAAASRAVRWQGEELHRGIKPLTGSERCQSQAARTQRHHVACRPQAGVSLQVQAKELGQPWYAVRESSFSPYLRAELRHPHGTAC